MCSSDLSRQHALEMSQALKEMTAKLGIGLVYKTSFDKANRSSVKTARGLGMKKSLPIMAEVRETHGIPVLTDVHAPEQHDKRGAEQQRGGVDAISTTPFEQGVKDGLADMTNYLSSGGRMGIFATVMTSINLDRWKSFPKPLQDVFTTAADNALAWYIDAQSKETDECVEILLKSKRIQVVPIDAAEEKRWREATSQVIFNKYAEAAKRTEEHSEQLHLQLYSLLPGLLKLQVHVHLEYPEPEK